MLYLLGLDSTADDKGKFAAIGSAMIVVGASIGPAIGGILVETGGYQMLVWFIGADGVIALLLLMFVLRN